MPVPSVVAALSELICYLVLPASDLAACDALGCIPYRLASLGKSYVGLRERVQDAILRYHQFFEGPFTIVKVTFTPLGLAHYTVACAGKQHGFSSNFCLSKSIGDRQGPKTLRITRCGTSMGTCLSWCATNGMTLVCCSVNSWSDATLMS